MFTSLKTEFANRLAITDANQVLALGDFLDSLDLYLISNGVNFTSDTATETITFYNRELVYKTLFTFSKWLTVANASVKLVDGTTETILTKYTDFAFYTSLATPKPASHLVLLNRYLTSTQKLQITGIWKFGSTLPVDLKLAGLQLASQFMAKSNQNLANQSGFSKSSVSIDKVSYSLKLTTSNATFQDEDFQKVLAIYSL